MRRVDLQVYWLPVDAFIAPCYSGGLVLYFSFDLPEVAELSAGHVVEFGPFSLPRHAGSRMRDVDLISLRLIVSFAGNIDELQNQRSPRHDAASARQEVALSMVSLKSVQVLGASTYTADIFENGGFSRGLRAYYHLEMGQPWSRGNALGWKANSPYNLRQVQGVISDRIEHQVLQLVYDTE